MRIFLLIVLLSVSLFSKSFLWEVSDGNSKIYLLGSVHIANESAYPLAEIINNSYNESDALVLEIVLDEINPFEMMGKMMLTDGSTLKDALGEEEFAKVKEKFDSLGVPELAYIKLKPWAATLVLMQQSMTMEGFDTELGFDKHFLKKAREDKKEVFGLETVDEQFGAFEQLAGMSSEFFNYSVKELENSKNMVDEMLTAWKEGDVKKINDIINLPASEMKDYDKVTEILLDKRNIKMKAKIDEYLKNDKKYFVIVGAGHLVGEKGLLNLLSKNKKYKLKQL